MSESVKAMPDYARVENLRAAIMANVEQQVGRHINTLTPWRRLMDAQIKAYLTWEEGERVRDTPSEQQAEAAIRFMAWVVTRAVCDVRQPYGVNMANLCRLVAEVEVSALSLLGNPVHVMPNEANAGHG